MSSPTRYLITGGAGFIGSHLSEALVDAGRRVVAIDDLSTGRIENLAALRAHPNFHFVRAAIEDEVVIDRLTSETDVIVHLAAAVGVMLIVEQPVHAIETNVGGRNVCSRPRVGTAAGCSSLARPKSMARATDFRSARTMTSC